MLKEFFKELREKRKKKKEEKAGEMISTSFLHSIFPIQTEKIQSLFDYVDPALLEL